MPWVSTRTSTFSCAFSKEHFQMFAPKRPTRCAPVSFVQRLYFSATVPFKSISCGVISPPATRGITEY